MPATFDPAALITSGPTSSSINDQLPVTPPTPSPEGDKVIDLDAFDAVKQGQRLDANKPPAAPPKEPENKDKVNTELEKEEAEALKKQEEKEAKVKELEKQELEVKPPPTAKPIQQTKVEDTAKFEEEIKAYVPETAIPLLKKASKETQEFILAEFKRNKTALDSAKAELETAKKSVREGLPTSWYEHENAFILTPEYQGAIQKANSLKSYADHYRQQLIAIKDGEKWIDLEVNAEGKIIQVPKEPGSAAEVFALQQIQRFENALQQESNKAATIANNFKQQVSSVRGDMKKAEDEFFPQYTQDFDKNEHGGYVMKVLAAKGQQNNPLAGFLAKLYATFIEENAEHEKLKAEVAKKKTITKVNNGPTGDEIDHGEKTGGVPVNIEDQPFDPNAFEAVINRQR